MRAPLQGTPHSPGGAMEAWGCPGDGQGHYFYSVTTRTMFSCPLNRMEQSRSSDWLLGNLQLTLLSYENPFGVEKCHWVFSITYLPFTPLA